MENPWFSEERCKAVAAIVERLTWRSLNFRINVNCPMFFQCFPISRFPIFSQKQTSVPIYKFQVFISSKFSMVVLLFQPFHTGAAPTQPARPQSLLRAATSARSVEALREDLFDVFHLDMIRIDNKHQQTIYRSLSSISFYIILYL